MCFFSKNTTCEKENGLLLTEVFKKLFNPQNDGHLDLSLGGHFLYVRVFSNFAFWSI